MATAPSAKSEDPMDLDDPVEQEIDVFVSQGLAGLIYVFQYPLRPPWRPYNLTRVQEARMKSALKKVELDIELDTDTAQYNPESTNVVKTLTLTSSYLAPRTNYMLGVLRADQLHLTPIEAIVQLRPSYGYIDAIAAAEAAKKAKKKEDVAEEEEEEFEAQPAQSPHGDLQQPVQLIIKKRDNEKVIEAHRNSYAYLKQREEEEPWVRMNVHLPHSAESMITFEKLLSQSAARIPFEVDPASYLAMINPAPAMVNPAPPPTNPAPHSGDKPGAGADQAKGASPADRAVESGGPAFLGPAKTLSQTALAHLPLDTQLQLLLSHAHALPLARVCEITKRPAAEVLPALEKVASVVRGNWVVHSALVCPDAHQAACRDFILLQYLEESRALLQRPDVARETGLSPDAARVLLEQVARLVPGRGWVFRLARDDEFLRQHPQIAERHRQAWNARAVQIVQAMKTPPPARAPPSASEKGKGPARAPAAPAAPAAAAAAAAKPAPAAAAAAASSSSGAATASGLEALKAAVAAAVERELAGPLGDLLEAAFRTHGVCSADFLQRLVGAEPWGPRLPAGALDRVLAAACTPLHRAFVLAHAADPRLEKFRAVVLDLFRAKAAIRRQEVKAAVMARFGEDMPGSTFQKVMKELAVARGALWIFLPGNGEKDVPAEGTK